MKVKNKEDIILKIKEFIDSQIAMANRFYSELIKNKINLPLTFLEGAKELFYLFLALLVGIGFHELGHLLASGYYHLNPQIGISRIGIFISTDSSSRYINEIITNAGVITNLLVVFVLAVLFFIREKRCKKNSPLCYFLFLIIIANLIIALISLMLFPFSLTM